LVYLLLNRSHSWCVVDGFAVCPLLSAFDFNESDRFGKYASQHFYFFLLGFASYRVDPRFPLISLDHKEDLYFSLPIRFGYLKGFVFVV